MRASAGAGGTRDERIELPAVLSAGQAKNLVEDAFARRWRKGDKIRLRLPPSRIAVRPGQAVQLSGTSRALMIRSVAIEGMAVAIEAEAAPVSVPALPAAPGRGVSEPDVPVGRTELALFELPPTGDAPDAMIKAFVAGSNAGMWRSAPIEVALGATPLSGVAVTRRSILGLTETILEGRAPLILDELSTVIVRLANPTHYLLNADHDALMGGANLAIIGQELIQFGRAEQLGEGLYRLSRLLRGRRGTEWAAATHSVGERFSMIDLAAMAMVELPSSATGSTLAATAHGIGDFAPLPATSRLVSGESLRPPAPCHLTLFRDGPVLRAEWTRRSHRGWAWADGLGVGDDPFPELYRVTLIGSAGQLSLDSATASAAFDIVELPAEPGEPIDLAVSMVGPAALSHAATAAIIL
jgi:hypothetical protein